MPQTLTALTDLAGLSYDDIIDVRSPAEFAQDHVPGAISLPVLSDKERARVGTIYKQVNPFDARKIGAALVSRNAATHIEGPLANRTGGWRPLVYCWRGGQRSGSFAVILKQIGWRADTLEGGYRAYRRLVARLLHDDPLPWRIILIDGNTGTAKTRLLGELAAQGAQVLDLEHLAQHKGSLFGGLNGPQPAQKMFESRLASALIPLDPARQQDRQPSCARLFMESDDKSTKVRDNRPATGPSRTFSHHLPRPYIRYSGAFGNHRQIAPLSPKRSDRCLESRRPKR